MSLHSLFLTKQLSTATSKHANGPWIWCLTRSQKRSIPVNIARNSKLPLLYFSS